MVSCRRRSCTAVGAYIVASLVWNGAIQVQALAVGSRHTCVLLDDDSVKCFGQNEYGQLGQGDTDARNTSDTLGDNLLPVSLGSGQVVGISAGSDHTCVVFSDGRLKCFGKNDQGQLGLDDTENRGDDSLEMGTRLPDVDLGLNRTAIAVTADGDRTCALLDTYDVRCWGDGEFGGLGNGAESNTGNGVTAVDIMVDIGDSSAIAVGEGPCVVTNDRTVKCWGKGYYGKNGQGDGENVGDESGEMGDQLGAVPLGAGVKVQAVSGGRDFVCALLVDGSVKCWGRGEGGQLGTEDIATLGDDPSELGQSALSAVALGTGVTAAEVTAGQQHTCALLDTGAVKCWGDNFYGNLGLGSFRPKGNVPNTMGDVLPEVDLGTGRTVEAIRARGDRTCAILDNGDLKCWGYNEDGILGLGDTDPRGMRPSDMGDDLPAVDLGTNRTAVALASVEVPTEAPTASPTHAPTSSPTSSISETPTLAPTQSATAAPSQTPTETPLVVETPSPTLPPTLRPTLTPTLPPTPAPTSTPTQRTMPGATPGPTTTTRGGIAADSESDESSDDRTATIIASVAAPVGILFLLGGILLYARRRSALRASAAAVGAKATEGPESAGEEVSA